MCWGAKDIMGSQSFPIVDFWSLYNVSKQYRYSMWCQDRGLQLLLPCLQHDWHSSTFLHRGVATPHGWWRSCSVWLLLLSTELHKRFTTALSISIVSAYFADKGVIGHATRGELWILYLKAIFDLLHFEQPILLQSEQCISEVVLFLPSHSNCTTNLLVCMFEQGRLPIMTCFKTKGIMFLV